jgi:integrase
MPKRVSLQPRKSKLENLPWMINLPARITDSGKRERRFFATKAKAATFGDQQRVRLDNFGTAATLLSPGDLEQASAAFAQIRAYGVSLSTVVAHYVDWRKRRDSSVTFKDLFDMFVSAEKRSEAHTRGLKYTLPRFAGLHQKPVSEITSRDLEREIHGMTPSVKNAFLRNLRAVFNYGLKRGFLAVNPVSGLDFAKLPEKEVVTLTTAQAAELMAAAEADFDLLPYHAIGLFGGIRPMELQRLAWSDLDLREKHIHIRPEVSKTGRRRIVDMEPNLCAWLGAFIARGGNAKGPVTPSVNLRKRLREVRSTAGVGDWHQDVMRHTYASNWLAKHGDINKLTLFMGHESTDMLWKHYHKATKQRDAARYWKIKPSADRVNVVPMRAA